MLRISKVFLDCTDIIDYNADLLNSNDLPNSFFCTDRQDPTIGFAYDASHVFGPTFPEESDEVSQEEGLRTRLTLGSHLAKHLRHRLEEEYGYTATVGISTNKLLSKLVGNVNKPKNQTTLMPPYEPTPTNEGNPVRFMDGHDIGKVPGIGFKSAEKIRALMLGRPATFDKSLIYGGTLEKVTVRDVRMFPNLSPQLLEETLTGPGSQKGIGGIIFNLMHGIDDTEVSKAKRVPSQISIEDSYIRLDTIEKVRKELLMLSQSLIKRMHLDLLEDDDFDVNQEGAKGDGHRRWLAHPRTLRLSTRPRPPVNADGTRSRAFNRISRSCPTPNFIFNLQETTEVLAEKLVNESLMTSFRKLHPERSGWNLSLVNVAVTNMAETAADSKDSEGRDIGKMFRRQDDVLKEWKVRDENSTDSVMEVEDVKFSNGGRSLEKEGYNHGSGSGMEETIFESPQTILDGEWEDEEEDAGEFNTCHICAARLPIFALDAHLRFHEDPD